MKNILNRIKLSVADRLGLRKLFAVTTYLLIRQMQSDKPEGPLCNRRLQDAFFSLFDILQPNLFFDIGANDGSASMTVRQVAPSCVVHAFEANPQIHAKYKTLLEEAGVQFWNLAVGDQIGKTTIYAPRILSRAYINGEIVQASFTEAEDTGKSSLLRRNENATYTEFNVDVTTLDAFLDAHEPNWRDRTIFLWIDVEGASDRVLAGAEQILKRTRAVFLETEGFEFWQDQADSGSVVTLLMRAGFLPVARDREYGDKQFNILFVHQDVIDKIIPQLFDANSALRLCDAAAIKTATTKTVTTPNPVESVSISRPFLSLATAMQADIPVFIPCFNAVTYTRSMVEQLRARGLRQIFLVDNASTYPPMREYLAAPGSGVNVIALPMNKGPHHIFRDPANLALMPQLFCVTDPDLLLNPAMPEDFLAQLAALTEKLSVGKAGLALDIADHDALRQEDFLIGDKHWKIWEWEEQFWREPLEPLQGGDPVFNALVDTTFALYNKRYFDIDNHLKAVRVAGRYTCRHLPWYKDVGMPASEELYYRSHARDSYYLRDKVDSLPRVEAKQHE